MIRELRLAILVVDDDATMRWRIRELLEEVFVAAFVGEAASAAEGFVELGARTWDLVVLDMRMPTMDGFATVREMRRGGFHVPVIMLSGLPADQYAAAARRAGASAYVTKDRAPDELVPTILSVLQEHHSAQGSGPGRKTKPDAPFSQ